MKSGTTFIQGNEAIARGALYAGLQFFAGYPITPSTEIAEILSEKLPKLGRKFVQMEDEISSMCAIIGASLTGLKVMTATSGPGFSLKQEAIGYAVMAEVPSVVVNVQRGGAQHGVAHGRRPGRCDAGKMGNPRGSFHHNAHSFQPSGCFPDDHRGLQPG